MNIFNLFKYKPSKMAVEAFVEYERKVKDRKPNEDPIAPPLMFSTGPYLKKEDIEYYRSEIKRINNEI